MGKGYSLILCMNRHSPGLNSKLHMCGIKPKKSNKGFENGTAISITAQVSD